MNKKIMSYGIAFALGLCAVEANAALTSNSVLSFNPGEIFCPIGGTYPNCDYGVTNVAASWFAMDMNGNGSVSASEKIALSANDGITIGQAQDAFGTHSGASDGTETAGIDNPWNFFGNAGLHRTTGPVNISSGDDGAGDGIASLDFSGWAVTWNAIPNINMGSGANSLMNNPESIAVLACDLDCSAGEMFTLEYSATVPAGDPSGFGGVGYALHLEGQISSVPVPAAVWLFGSGLLGLFGVAKRKARV